VADSTGALAGLDDAAPRPLLGTSRDVMCAVDGDAAPSAEPVTPALALGGVRGSTVVLAQASAAPNDAAAAGDDVDGDAPWLVKHATPGQSLTAAVAGSSGGRYALDSRLQPAQQARDGALPALLGMTPSTSSQQGQRRRRRHCSSHDDEQHLALMSQLHHTVGSWQQGGPAVMQQQDELQLPHKRGKRSSTDAQAGSGTYRTGGAAADEDDGANVRGSKRSSGNAACALLFEQQQQLQQRQQLYRPASAMLPFANCQKDQGGTGEGQYGGSRDGHDEDLDADDQTAAMAIAADFAAAPSSSSPRLSEGHACPHVPCYGTANQQPISMRVRAGRLFPAPRVLRRLRRLHLGCPVSEGEWHGMVC
jgi:hypothetical protein